MQLSSVKPGDIVLCNVRGRVFHAEVKEKLVRKLRVEPINPNVNLLEVKAGEVTRHWRAPRARKAG